MSTCHKDTKGTKMKSFKEEFNTEITNWIMNNIQADGIKVSFCKSFMIHSVLFFVFFVSSWPIN